MSACRILKKGADAKGDIPSQKLAEIRRIKHSEIDKMIDRVWNDTLNKASALKTESGKTKKIQAFRDEMDKYSDFMSDSNIDKYENLAEQYLINK